MKISKICLVSCLLYLVSTSVHAQKLSFSNHRDIEIPEYALLRIGPFYSNLTLTQEVGYRYTEGSGTGTDFLFANRRGVIKEDGVDFPLLTTLDFRNYILLTRHIDLDISGKIVGSYYPNETQENLVYLDLVDEGLFGNLSTEIELSPFLKLMVYERASYQTDYIDTRGWEDEYGGQLYENFQNDVGLNLDWLMAPEKNMHLSFNRKDVLPSDDEFDEQKRVEMRESIAYEQMISVFMSGGVRGGANQLSYDSTNRSDTAAYDASLFANSKVTKNTIMNTSVGYSESELGSEGNAAQEDNFEDVSSAIIGGVSFETALTEGMMHSYGYMRSQRGGFTSAAEISNNLFYNLKWAGEFTTIDLSVRRDLIETSRIVTGEYLNWINSINISRELLSFLTLRLRSSYTIRDNKNEADFVFEGETVEIEWSDDYQTWLTKVSTSFGVTEKVDFDVSYSYVQRTSDSEDLNYERNLVEAKFVYTHEF